MLSVVFQAKNDRRPLSQKIGFPFMDLTNNTHTMLALVEGDPGTFDPYVLVISSDRDGAGAVCLKMGLEEYVKGAAEMVEHATKEWNWSDLDQRFSVDPNSKRTYVKKMLEEIVEGLLEQIDQMEE
jgi:hypothetical protein